MYSNHFELPSLSLSRVRDRSADAVLPNSPLGNRRSSDEETGNGSWRGYEELLNATRSQLAARQAQEKAELRDQQKLEHVRLQQERERFPDFKDWLAERSPDLAQEWRYPGHHLNKQCPCA